MAVLEMRADDLHAVLGRLLDQVRMAGIPVVELSVRADKGGYTLCLALDTGNCDALGKLVRRADGIVGVTGLQFAEGSAHPSALGSAEAA